MKKFFLVGILSLFVIHSTLGQNADLLVKSSDKGLYLEHKVAAKQSFFSIGRLYNIHPKTLAAYNKLDISKGLLIGQQMRIPLNDTNFTQKGNSGTPVYYKTAETDGLMKVSSMNRDVSLANLRHWNGLSSDKITPGKKMIIGFLLTKEMPSVTIKGTPVIKDEPVAVVEEKKEEEKPVVKEEPKVEIKEEPKTVKEEPKTVSEEPKKPEPVFAKVEEKPVSASSENGYFKYHFEQQVKTNPIAKNETVTSGIFKTTSGWLDAKYYMLMDNVQPGTIVKLTNPSNNKTIYAKVLGQMAGIKQNEGFDIRISSAGASALQVTEQDKFIVKVNY
jgi:LysM repeat protein